MKRNSPITKYLKKSKHLPGCKVNKKEFKCSCGFFEAVNEYLQLRTIQRNYYEALSVKMLKNEME